MFKDIWEFEERSDFERIDVVHWLRMKKVS